MKSLIVIPALLPSMTLLCYYLQSSLSPSILLSIFAGVPVLVSILASAIPDLIPLCLFPFLLGYKITSLLVGKLKQIVQPPDLQFVPKGRVKKIAIIGAGSSGITAAKEAIEAGFDVVVFEQTDAIGGNWVFRETDAHSSVYRSTVINTSKQLMSYSDFPMSSDTPTYPHHSQIIKYFHSYADHFGVMEKIRFHTRVLSVELFDGDRWRVTTCPTDKADVGKPAEEFAKLGDVSPSDSSSDSSNQTVEEYDAVLVCNGHHSVPLWPEYPGQSKFKGNMIHSHSYKDPTSCDKGFDYRGKRVVVVGVGNSGVDIAVELSRVTEELYLSTRSGTWVMPKYVSGTAVDHTWNLKRIEAMCLPEDILNTEFFTGLTADIFEHRIQGVQGNMHDWGLRPKHRFTEAHITIHQDLLHRIGLGSISMQDNIKEIVEDGVIFQNGQLVKVDAIIFSTGYLIRFPFLNKEQAPVNDENHVRLYRYMLNPKHPPTMSFIGFVQPLGALMPISELQSRWAMQILKGERGVPKPEEMDRLITERLNLVWKKFLPRPRHTTEALYHTIMERLAEEVGCVPRVWNPRNWKVLKELLLAPAGWPFTYRLQGPNHWEGAADALKTAFKQMGKHP